jgi:hypothetical protein
MSRLVSGTPIRCQLSDYYRSGISILLAQRFLDALEREEHALPDISSWRQFELRKNLWALGFLESRDEPRGFNLSSRGYSLLVLPKLVKRRVVRLKVCEMLERYIVLKAMADVDWECFCSFLVALYQKKMRKTEIHNRLYPEDSQSNFSHRFGLHQSVALQTQVNRLLQADKSSLVEIDPYSRRFGSSAFFGSTLSAPPKSAVRNALQKSLAQFDNGILGRGPLLPTEALKTVVEAVLLSDDYFSPEPALSSVLLELLIRQHVSIYQNPGYLKHEGRGLFRNERFYTIFSVPRDL